MSEKPDRRTSPEKTTAFRAGWCLQVLLLVGSIAVVLGLLFLKQSELYFRYGGF